MALIDLQNISKQYDTKIILKDVNFTLNSGQRIAVIGQNGQGKSTLFKIIMRQTEPDSGEMAIDKSLKIEMLDQQPRFKANLTVRDAIENQLAELKTAKVEYEKITNQFSEFGKLPKQAFYLIFGYLILLNISAFISSLDSSSFILPSLPKLPIPLLNLALAPLLEKVVLVISFCISLP
mgnify:CR=1 FL=1